MPICRGWVCALLLLIVSWVAVAAPVFAGEMRLAAAAAACPDKVDGTLTVARAPHSDGTEPKHSVAGKLQLSPETDRLEEYLDLHTRIREENRRASLMPWPGVRTHAN
jgi:hypothetical protein